MNYQATEAFKKWWDANYSKLRGQSSHTKGAASWNAALLQTASQVVADERAAFEAHIGQAAFLDRAENNKNVYRLSSINDKWDTWQARAAFAAAPVHPVAMHDGWKLEDELPPLIGQKESKRYGKEFTNGFNHALRECRAIIATHSAAPAAQGDAKDAGLPAGVVVTAFQAAHDKSWWISIKHPFGYTNKLATQGRDIELCRLLVAHTSAIAAKAAL